MKYVLQLIIDKSQEAPHGDIIEKLVCQEFIRGSIKYSSIQLCLNTNW